MLYKAFLVVCFWYNLSISVKIGVNKTDRLPYNAALQWRKQRR